MTNKFHLLTPLSWAQYALKEANDLIGSDQYEEKMVEYRRFMLFHDYMQYVKNRYGDNSAYNMDY